MFVSDGGSLSSNPCQTKKNLIDLLMNKRKQKRTFPFFFYKFAILCFVALSFWKRMNFELWLRWDSVVSYALREVQVGSATRRRDSVGSVGIRSDSASACLLSKEQYTGFGPVR